MKNKTLSPTVGYRLIIIVTLGIKYKVFPEKRKYLHTKYSKQISLMLKANKLLITLLRPHLTQPQIQTTLNVSIY